MEHFVELSGDGLFGFDDLVGAEAGGLHAGGRVVRPGDDVDPRPDRPAMEVGPSGGIWSGRKSRNSVHHRGALRKKFEILNPKP